MNNQFFGDERDFYQYALLHILAGGKLDYLQSDNDREKCIDTELFDFSRRWVCDERSAMFGKSTDN